MYKNIIFDFYGTLVDMITDEESNFLWDKLSLFMSYRKATYKSEELKEAFNKIRSKHLARYSENDFPEVDITDVFYKLYMDKGIKVKPKTLKSTVLLYRTLTIEEMKVHDGVNSLLKELKKKEYNLYILANGQREYILAELYMLGLNNYFQAVYVSSDYHMAKPNPDFYDHLIKKEKLSKEKTIMVGNQYSTDIKGANKAGMDSLFIMTETSDLKAKKEKATYSIMDGDYSKIMKTLTKG